VLKLQSWKAEVHLLGVSVLLCVRFQFAIMAVVQTDANDRIRGALGAAAVQVLLGYALIVGLAVEIPASVDDGLKLFSIAPEPPPRREKIVPPAKRSKRPEGAASPPNLKAKATEIAAPVPVIQLMAPPPVVAALKPGIGAAPFSGASNIRGPGTGSGGQGDGTGSGDGGDGDGGGGEDTPPRWRKGRLSNSDYPETLGVAGAGGTVSVRYTVATTGRVTACAVTRSSGHSALDDLTCRLIRQRFVFEPSRDPDGRPVPSVVVENHEWVVEDSPEPPASGQTRARRGRRG